MRLVAGDYEEKDIIKIIREWTELSRDEFSKSVGINARVIESYEQGRRSYSFKTLMKIAKAHNIEITFNK